MDFNRTGSKSSGRSVQGMRSFNAKRRAEHDGTSAMLSLLRPVRGLGGKGILRLVPVVVQGGEGVGGGEGTKGKRKRR